MAQPNKENPKVKESFIEDGKVVILEKEYTEKRLTMEKGEVENHLFSAKQNLAEAQKQVDEWQEKLDLFK